MERVTFTARAPCQKNVCARREFLLDMNLSWNMPMHSEGDDDHRDDRPMALDFKILWATGFQYDLSKHEQLLPRCQ